MAQKYNRKIKNFLINKDFQVRFLIRFFLFSFLILLAASTLQYFYADMTFSKHSMNLNSNLINQQESLLVSLKNYRKTLDIGLRRIPIQMQKIMKHSLDKHKNLITDELKFIENHIKSTREQARLRKNDSLMGFIISVVVIGFIVNTLFSILYGIYLSHNIAGNHYRLKKFAKQLQNKNLKEPLVVRSKDFFKDTAAELEACRKMFNNDLISIKKESGSKIIDSYQLDG